ncbi:hypothetical protein T459_28165 [Capsicum annuum]|uniref:Uncharacterized protein n=1 Tax=Capsicum annuum TaxID=4072 RepID=A0A2G2YFZ5_CAPAN|nr:hypothetical protein T459_28165 [Capsicum annuum]
MEMDNNYAIEKDIVGIGEPWTGVDEEGERINSIDLSLSSAISLITELDIVTGLQLTYDGKLEVMDVLNFMENGGKNLLPGDNVQLKRAHRTVGHTQCLKIQGVVAAWKSFMVAYLVALDSKGSHAITSRHCEQLTDSNVASRQGSTLPLGAS